MCQWLWFCNHIMLELPLHKIVVSGLARKSTLAPPARSLLLLIFLQYVSLKKVFSLKHGALATGFSGGGFMPVIIISIICPQWVFLFDVKLLKAKIFKIRIRLSRSCTNLALSKQIRLFFKIVWLPIMKTSPMFRCLVIFKQKVNTLMHKVKKLVFLQFRKGKPLVKQQVWLWIT